MKLQSIIHHPEKFVSKSFRETLETTNSGLVWMSFISDCSHNFSNYESRLNIEYMHFDKLNVTPSGEQFSEQHCSMPLPYIFNAKQLNIKHLSYTLGKWFGIKPQIFKENPLKLKNITLFLNFNKYIYHKPNKIFVLF